MMMAEFVAVKGVVLVTLMLMAEFVPAKARYVEPNYAEYYVSQYTDSRVRGGPRSNIHA